MTKYYIYTALIILSFVSCKNDNARHESHSNEITKEVSTDSIEGAYLSLDKTKYDFGKIRRKKTPYLTIDFEVENIGKKPLVILKTDVSCGCISIECPKEPILPGKKIKLTLTIDTKNQDGVFNKTVFLKSNAENDVVLIRIIGEVK